MGESSAAHASPVANKVVSWLVLLFGLMEVPWVIYLAFTQLTTVEANHLRFAALGLGFGGAALCAWAAWALWRRHPVGAALAVGSATLTLYLGVSMTLTPGLSASDFTGYSLFLLMAVPGTIAGVMAANYLLRGRGDTRRRAIVVAAVVLGLVALAFAGHALAQAADPETTGWVSRARAIVVILDTGESVGLIGAGIASLRGHARSALVFSVIAATLLMCDAFANVVGAAPGVAFQQAVFYLLVGEIPSIVLCLFVARSAYRTLGPAAMLGSSTPDAVVSPTI
ncbi:MAG: hypothetical protein ACH36H_04140 [Candidatus Nanopelagicales bacterium]